MPRCAQERRRLGVRPNLCRLSHRLRWWTSPRRRLNNIGLENQVLCLFFLCTWCDRCTHKLTVICLVSLTYLYHSGTTWIQDMCGICLRYGQPIIRFSQHVQCWICPVLGLVKVDQVFLVLILGLVCQLKYSPPKIEWLWTETRASNELFIKMKYLLLFLCHQGELKFLWVAFCKLFSLVEVSILDYKIYFFV